MSSSTPASSNSITGAQPTQSGLTQAEIAVSNFTIKVRKEIV
jgi:hypothetical protein